MRSSGIVRKIDKHGKITIPSELRKLLNIQYGDFIDITKEGNTILLNKYERKCIICGSDNDLLEYRRGSICLDCVEDISDLICTNRL